MNRLIRGTGAPVTLIVLAGAAPTLAGSFEVPIDEGRSRLTFELCVSDRCDDDSSPVAGGVTISLDSIGDPALLTLWDFDMALTETIDVTLSWGFLGRLEAMGSGVRLTYAFPGEPVGPAPIEGGGYTLLDIPTNTQGHVEYLATGLPCILLEQFGMECEAAIELEDIGTQNLEEFSGTITIENRVVTLLNDVDFTVPIDPKNPDLGTIRVFGTVTGSVELPVLTGDVDDDFDVDLDDYAAWFACMGGPGVTEPPDGCTPDAFAASDLDDDSDVDIGDYLAMQGLLVAG
jgi:hypothetical protein